MFGAYFGLAASKALGGPKDVDASPDADKVSDILALVGTTILWVYWPSFVGATETAVLENEQHCVVNTIMALIASTTMSFFLSHRLTHGKFDPVHVANSTLAGGVAIGSAARLNIGPGGAVVVGALAGAASVYGYVYSSPYLESVYGIYDTCGVGNLVCVKKERLCCSPFVDMSHFNDATRKAWLPFGGWRIDEYHLDSC